MSEASTAHHRGNADRACSSQGGRSRTRAGILLRRARLRADAAHGAPGGVHFGRRLSSPHRAEHLGEQGRSSAAARHHRTVSHRDPLSDPRRAGRRAAPRDAGGHSISTAPAITASARRCTCAIPTRTASSCIGTGPRSNGRARPTARWRCSRAGSISTICCGSARRRLMARRRARAVRAMRPTSRRGRGRSSG